ncbi:MULTISPECIES: hypothetical protein [Marivivens]|jgi:hypothetical protein|uniref:hypothetical protein n=1 Tax=Marivivens TaxID=1759396 RepID=UPI000AAB0EFF|nr:MULTISPECIES: hypothetical protein [Marivivens]MCL7409698.1 hypothetical protein [Marivivens donghaensis]MDN3705133.1 hypothetical protein [Marivivens donghaensis]
MVKIIDHIWSEDKGSDLVDWVVLTAGLIMLAVAVVAVIDTSTGKFAADSLPLYTATGV